MDQFEKDFNASIPPILYKYRDWSNSHHRRILTDGEIYFASIDQLNDPYDCTLPFRIKKEHLTEDKIFLKYIQMTKEMHPEWDDQKIHEEAYKEQKVGRFHDPTHLEWVEEQEHKTLNGYVGVFCVAASFDKFLMWSHYTNSHTGFCVGFDSWKLFKSTQAAVGEVAYSDEIPEYDLFEERLVRFMKITGTKSKIWEYESEYRLRKALHPRKIIHVNLDVISELYLGVKMSFDTKTEIIELVKKICPHVKVFEMQLDKQVFKLKNMRVY